MHCCLLCSCSIENCLRVLQNLQLHPDLPASKIPNNSIPISFFTFTWISRWLKVPPCCLLYIICFIYLELGGGNSKIFVMFTPKIGEDVQFWLIFFQMGWFNHQPVNLLVFHPIHREIGISGKTNPLVGCFCRLTCSFRCSLKIHGYIRRIST